MTTARQLYDAAIAAKLAMPGLMLEDRPLHDSSLLVYADFSVSEYVGKWRVASLADVECAVMDALVAAGVRLLIYGLGDKASRRWETNVGIPAPSGMMLWTGFNQFDDRASALIAACKALAKEAK